MRTRWSRQLAIRALCAVLAISSVGFVLTNSNEAAAIENAPPWAYAMAARSNDDKQRLGKNLLQSKGAQYCLKLDIHNGWLMITRS